MDQFHKETSFFLQFSKEIVYVLDKTGIRKHHNERVFSKLYSDSIHLSNSLNSRDLLL